jgi:hypothetical protein
MSPLTGRHTGIDPAQASAAGRRGREQFGDRDLVLAAKLGAFMARRFAHRLTAAFLVVLSLLFSQLALAGYVCPEQQDVASMAETMASGVPCEGMDMDQPALCAEHSVGAPQSFEPVKLPSLSAPMVLQVIELPLEPDAAGARAMPGAATPEAQAPPDPLFLSTLRLRV